MRASSNAQLAEIAFLVVSVLCISKHFAACDGVAGPDLQSPGDKDCGPCGQLYEVSVPYTEEECAGTVTSGGTASTCSGGYHTVTRYRTSYECGPVPADERECRLRMGPCDVAERCDGESMECPAADFVAPSGMVCWASRGPCDVFEACDGESKECPRDEVYPEGHECTVETDAGQLSGTCDGTSKECTVNASASE